MSEIREHPFTTEVVRRDGVAIVVVRGEIDMATAPWFRQVVEVALDEGGRLEVDLHETTFMDSTGLAVLVDAYRRLGQAHEAIVLRDPQPRVRRVLHVSGVDTFVDVREDAATFAADG